MTGLVAVLVAVLHHPKPKPADDANPPVIQTPFTAASLIRAGDPLFGNPAAAVTIMDFYDIRCPPCRAMNERIHKLIETVHDFRYVPVEYPILGPAGMLATRALYAPRMQGGIRPVAAVGLRQRPGADRARRARRAAGGHTAPGGGRGPPIFFGVQRIRPPGIQGHNGRITRILGGDDPNRVAMSTRQANDPGHGRIRTGPLRGANATQRDQEDGGRRCAGGRRRHGAATSGD
jgi:hypothetical protein